MDKKKTKENALSNFDPNGMGLIGNGIFGLPFDEETADTIIIPVPWEVTVSSQEGTAANFQEIFDASLQVDLYDDFNPDFWKDGIAVEKELLSFKSENAVRRSQAKEFLEIYSKLLNSEEYKANESFKHKFDLKDMLDEKTIDLLNRVNDRCEKMVNSVKGVAKQYLDQGKMVGILGGDHSVSLGMIQALAEKHPEGFKILHIDAHADLREAYEGFTYSHASIMYNALQIPQVEKIVQIGIRDYCEEEYKLQKSSKVLQKNWRTIQSEVFQGKSWHQICKDILQHQLGPGKVYISFDIDGLDPSLCPNTGTPVPGGLSYDQAVYLLEMLGDSAFKKQIIGFDLVEVGNDPWDANVGARMLYKLCSVMHKSQTK